MDTDSGLAIVDNPSGSNYLARGHLSPDASFVTQLEQDATYYFLNVAPQYQSTNNANWKALEGAVRDYAANQTHDVTVFTGTYGILQFETTGGTARNFFLHRPTGKSKMFFPPEIFWKVLHDPDLNKAVAFVGFNSPFLQQAPAAADLPCTNVCDQISWVDWAIDTLSSGYMICCAVDDLRASVSFVPDLTGVTLLT